MTISAAPPSANLAERNEASHELRSLRRAFARTVMVPGSTVFLLDDDNERVSGDLTLDEALDEGRAYVVTVADDVLALDADTADAVAVLSGIADDLRAAGHDPVIVASGQPDRRHLFARIRDAQLLAAYKEKAKTAAGRRDFVRQTIRPPLAPHRLGLPVALVEPDEPAEALAALTPSRRRRSALSARMETWLREGVPKGRRSEALQSVALAAYTADWTFERFAEVVLDGPLGEKAREQRDPQAYLRRSWAKARSFTGRSSPTANESLVAFLASFRAAMAAETWRGRGGATELVVLHAHLAIVERAGTREHGASARQIAELAKVRHSALARRQGVWQRLMRQGWLLRRSRHGDIASPSRWSLAIPLRHRGRGHPRDHSDIQRGVCRNGHVSDLWRWGRRGGLGMAAKRVYEALTAETKTSDLAKELGIKPPAVRRHLDRLLAARLITKTDSPKAGARWQRSSVTVDEVLQGRGVAGETERQHALHAEERRHYRARRHQQIQDEDETQRRFWRGKVEALNAFLARGQRNKNAQTVVVERHDAVAMNAGYSRQEEEPRHDRAFQDRMRPLRVEVEPVRESRAVGTGARRALRRMSSEISGAPADHVGGGPAARHSSPAHMDRDAEAPTAEEGGGPSRVSGRLTPVRNHEADPAMLAR